MSRAALQINDAGITLLSGGQILYREPAFTLLDADRLISGSAALARARINPRHVQHRYFRQLGTDALSEHTFSHLSAADLVSHQLESLWRQAGGGIDELVVAVPAWLEQEQLGLLLGIAGDLGLPVTALVDAAVAATRREYQGAVPVHIDMGLHTTTLSRISQAGLAQLERNEVIDDCGSYRLFDTWLNTVAAAFVQQSRFDPLHKAATEQRLLDELGAWLTQAGRVEVVALELESDGVTHHAEIESLSLIGAAAASYQQIADRLRSLYRADETPAIQLTDRVARLPGLADMLTARVGGEVYVLEAGATARGALARCRDKARSGSGVSLLRQLPWDQAAITVEQADPGVASAGVPTHLLHGDVAWAIGSDTLQIGTQSEASGRQLALTGDMAGISRQHCTVSRLNGQCVVEDQSRYGTFLNGHRINGSTVLQVGDVLRVGSPGFEFRMITTDENHGA